MNHYVPTPNPLRLEAGRGRLQVDVVAGQSTLTSAQASSPLKLLVPRSRGHSVWAYLSTFGGGLVAGDETDLDICVGAGARCFVSTQASTKVYRNPLQRACGQTLNAFLGEGSMLVLAPDPIQCFAGSQYEQRQEFHLLRGASLVLVDWLSSGRAACAERWAFTRFHSRNEVFLHEALHSDGREVKNESRVLVDSLLLDPADGPLDGPHRMGRFNCLALVLLLGDAVRETSARLLTDIGGQPIARRAPLVYSASPIHGGALLRIAGEQVEDVAREVHRHLGFLGALLGDDPLARKCQSH